MLTYGNIKRKSKLLKYYIFDELYDEALFKEEYSKYIESIKNIPGVEPYLAVRDYLHDAHIDKLYINKDIHLTLTLQKQEDNLPEHNHIEMIFINGRIESYNKILKSGKITASHSPWNPKTYLYDEFYSCNGRNILTIITTTKKHVATGVYFPLMSISFSSIKVLEL
jgi:hypothetical protein